MPVPWGICPMKHRILSDLHSEFWQENFDKALRMMDEQILPPLPDDKSTVLILAGDIGTAKRWRMLKAVLEYVAARFLAVIYVPGNHEPYQFDFRQAQAAILQVTRDLPNVYFAPNKIGIAGTEYVFATLWTDFGNEDPLVMLKAHQGMTDYKLIAFGDRLLEPADILTEHKQDLTFLKENMTEGCVVITHHAPLPHCIHPDFGGSPLNPCFASNLEELILTRKPKLWVYGHIHYARDFTIGDTRLVNNASGYPNEDKTGYINNLVIET